MAISLWRDLATESILSAHISGLSHSVKKFEETLNMKTEQSTFSLLPVIDQEDLSLRYRIYEGEHRNWVSFSVTRNGNSIDSAEYLAQPAFGVIVFHTPQNQTDEIKVTATYIIGESNRLQEIESNVSNHENDIVGMKSDLEILKNPAGTFDLSNSPKRYFNYRPGVFPKDSAAEGVSSILMASYRLEALPLILEERVTLTKMSMTFSSSSPTCDNLMGIYSNTEPFAPGEKLAETAIAAHGTAGREVLIADLKSPVTLDPGIYWMVRWHAGSARLAGEMFTPLVHISVKPPSLGLSDYGSGLEENRAFGVRTQYSVGTISSLPLNFPSIGSDAKYLIRDSLGSICAISDS